MAVGGVVPHRTTAGRSPLNGRAGWTGAGRPAAGCAVPLRTHLATCLELDRCYVGEELRASHET